MFRRSEQQDHNDTSSSPCGSVFFDFKITMCPGSFRLYSWLISMCPGLFRLFFDTVTPIRLVFLFSAISSKQHSIGVFLHSSRCTRASEYVFHCTFIADVPYHGIAGVFADPFFVRGEGFALPADTFSIGSSNFVNFAMSILFLFACRVLCRIQFWKFAGNRDIISMSRLSVGMDFFRTVLASDDKDGHLFYTGRQRQSLVLHRTAMRLRMFLSGWSYSELYDETKLV